MTLLDLLGIHPRHDSHSQLSDSVRLDTTGPDMTDEALEFLSPLLFLHLGHRANQDGLGDSLQAEFISSVLFLGGKEGGMVYSSVLQTI